MNLQGILYKGQGRWFLAAGAVTALGLALGGAAAMTAQAAPAPGIDVTLCHRTGSALGGNQQNGYDKITVNINSVQMAQNVRGHDGHNLIGNGPGGDIIPVFKYGDFTYPGKNLAGNEDFLKNGCNKGEQPPLRSHFKLPTLSATRVCHAVGSVNAEPNANFTWAVSGPETARWYTATAIGDVVLDGTNPQGPFDVSAIPSQSVHSAAACFVAKAIVKGVVKNAPVVAGEVENAPVVAGVVENAPVVAGVVENAPAVKSLAFTGAETVPLGLSGLLALVLGAVLTVASRQRPKQARE